MKRRHVLQLYCISNGPYWAFEGKAHGGGVEYFLCSCDDEYCTSRPRKQEAASKTKNDGASVRRQTTSVRTYVLNVLTYVRTSMSLSPCITALDVAFVVGVFSRQRSHIGAELYIQRSTMDHEDEESPEM